MGTRPPRDGREMVQATCENLRELADAYLPVLRYDDGEHFFPVRAESWLTHTTSAPWEAGDVEVDDLAVDPWRRGTTLMRWRDGGLEVVAGPPNHADRPLRIASSGGEDAIGRHTDVDADMFLDVAGWNPLGEQTSGDPDYLYDLFSELSAAMNPRMAWTRPEQRANLPHLWVPQPPNPTTYVEAAWAGHAARISDEHELKDFTAKAEGELGLLTLTYHYLYPCRGPLGDEAMPRRLEGQWEAITIVFEARADMEEAGDREFPELFFREPPLAVVVSRGLHRHGAPPAQEHKNLLAPWGDVETVVPGTTRPVVYVAKGTHRHYFKAEPDTRWDPDKPKPGTAGGGPGDIDEDQGDAIPGFEPWAAGAIAAAAAIPVIGPLLALILFLILLILWLASISHDSSGDPVPSGPQPDSAPGDGAQAGGGEGDSGQGSAAVPGSGDSVTGTNAGSPTGRDIVSFDIRLVDSVHRHDWPTDFPTKQRCEYPHWWDYSGGWGVRVRPALAQNWEDGMRRVDQYGRSWTYWNTLRFWLVRNGGSPGT